MKLRKPSESPDGLTARLLERLVGQPAAVRLIVPYVQMFQAGLAPEGRPIGVFLLLGPTGTGKTKTVEALAGLLHGSEKSILRVDCGEFQMEHEVAKLIGAPPGYLGHRETQPMFTQQKLNSIASEKSAVSIVLFDEIEKAAPSLTRLLLGILDKATLRLGDNATVNFERTLIFLTSNLGARGMLREIRPAFGFAAGLPVAPLQLARKIEAVGLAAVRRRFSPEFVNRVDVVVTYQPLSRQSLDRILDQQMLDLQRHVNERLGARRFDLDLTPGGRAFLLEHGTSVEYGARELKRTLHRHVIQPLAALVADGQVAPGALVRLKVDGEGLDLEVM